MPGLVSKVLGSFSLEICANGRGCEHVKKPGDAAMNGWYPGILTPNYSTIKWWIAEVKWFD
jgi:hypothetical protein